MTELEEPLTNTLLEPALETHTAAPSPLADLAKEGIRVVGVEVPGMAEILTPEALRFVALLQRTFNPRRLELLAAREERKLSLDAWEAIGFLPERTTLEKVGRLLACPTCRRGDVDVEPKWPDQGPIQ